MRNFWVAGDLVARREELGLQPSEVAQMTATVGVWLETPVFIVEDTAEHLVSYIAPGARFRFPSGPWVHPWSDRETWTGNVSQSPDTPNCPPADDARYSVEMPPSTGMTEPVV